MRTGLIGRKLGMTRVLSSEGKHIPVTLIDVKGNTVLSSRSVEKNGYIALQLGFQECHPNRQNKARKGYFQAVKQRPKKHIREFRVSEDMVVDAGAVLSAAHFVVGQKVDVSAKSIGKGFAGVMKRHNFSGLRASHGVSIAHRSHGSTGQCQDPGKVFKGKKMAGQLGNKEVTIQNLEVVSVDAENGLIAVKGHVPGAKHAIIKVRDAVKGSGDVELPLLSETINNSSSQDSAQHTAPASEE